MKIGVDNINANNLFKDSEVATEVNSSEFNALLSTLLIQLESNQIDLESVVSEDGVINLEQLDLNPELSQNIALTDTSQLLVSIEQLKSLVGEFDSIEYTKQEISDKSGIANLIEGLIEDENFVEEIPEIRNVFELQINQFNQEVKIPQEVISDTEDVVAAELNSLGSLQPFAESIGFESIVPKGTSQLLSSQVSVNQHNIVNAIKSKLNSSADNTLHKLTVRLHPEELGRINIELNLKDGIVSGVIRLNEEQAKVIFAENLEVIKNELQSQGIKVESLDINLSNDNSNSNMHREDTFKQFREQSGNRFATKNDKKLNGGVNTIDRKRINNLYREEGRVNILI